MKENKSTKIIGKNVIFIPYKENHVLRYHEWMKSEELQQLTASEPLTLEDEYKMQKSWFEDEDKCTFIILNKSLYEETLNEIDAMIGDINLFFNDANCNKNAEIEIMIAETCHRGKGYGWESAILMLRYGIENLNVIKYLAKISISNEKSINMFRKLGFEEVSRSDIFKEFTLQKVVDFEWIKWLQNQTPNMIKDENYK
ncbi:N-acetyltransferase 9-like protein isoform X1 [Phymastichus coffea]|uniref:N-acetyltransferase 9-like protein isoform X1 n=1 Tax=Phymastichus coffea TaxID=108790 RepID=UPI00273A7A68|nr:N-acetyltransferase 9-like protein isoform X1 [Phymastichus coffea]